MKVIDVADKVGWVPTICHHAENFSPMLSVFRDC